MSSIKLNFLVDGKKLSIQVAVQLLTYLNFFAQMFESQEKIPEEIDYDINVTRNDLKTYFGKWLSLMKIYSLEPLPYHPIFDSIIVREDEAEKLYYAFNPSSRNFSTMSDFTNLMKFALNDHREKLRELGYCNSVKCIKSSCLEDALDFFFGGKLKFNYFWIKPEYIPIVKSENSDFINCTSVKETMFKDYDNYYKLNLKPNPNPIDTDFPKLIILGEWVRNMNLITKDRLPLLLKELDTTLGCAMIAEVLHDKLFLDNWKMPSIKDVPDITILSKDLKNKYYKMYFEEVSKPKEFLNRAKLYCELNPNMASFFWVRKGKDVILGKLVVPQKKKNAFKNVTTLQSFYDQVEAEILKKFIPSHELEECQRNLMSLNTHRHSKKTKDYHYLINIYCQKFNIDDESCGDSGVKYDLVISKLNRYVTKLEKDERDVWESLKNKSKQKQK